MGLNLPDDLDRAALEPHLGDRPFRTYPAMLSTEAEALAWARHGAAHGSLVVTGYQASPRGRSGLSWAEEFADSAVLGASLVLHPDLPEAREGWLYLAVLLGTMEALDAGEDARLEWPDRVLVAGRTVAAVGVQTEPAAGRLRWAVATMLIPGVTEERAALAARLADRVDHRVTAGSADVVDVFRTSCATLGRRVDARILPMGAATPSFVGLAEDVAEDGGLVIATDEGRRVVVQPQSLGFLEEPDDPSSSGP